MYGRYNITDNPLLHALLDEPGTNTGPQPAPAPFKHKRGIMPAGSLIEWKQENGKQPSYRIPVRV
jgi:hypothetical protein